MRLEPEFLYDSRNLSKGTPDGCQRRSDVRRKIVPERLPTSPIPHDGGEYNVASGLKRCFGLNTSVVTAFADNPVGRLPEDLIFQGGIDQSLVRWMPL